MNCMKCGRETQNEQVFCQDCLQEMEKYIVGKPQTSGAKLWTADSSSQAPHTPSSRRGHLAITCESLCTLHSASAPVLSV